MVKSGKDFTSFARLIKKIFKVNILSFFRTSRELKVVIFLTVFLLGCGNSSQQSALPEKSTETVLPVLRESGEDSLEPAPLEDFVEPENFPTAPAISLDELNSFKPFYIYSDKGSNENHYVPSGFMPDGKCLSFDDAWGKDCHLGTSCIRVEYDTECSRKGQKWAGIYWLNPANNWGQRKGGFNLTGAQQLTFWARGENGDERIQEFTIGGIMGNYPDADIAVMGPVLLSNEWRRYTIDLRGKDLSYISGGFAWSTTADSNPQSCIFYLDDIRFE